MIRLENVTLYCNGNIADIENYAEAIADSKRWDCHHRMEVQPDGTILTREWMIKHDIYYNVDPCMLIFLKASDHARLHGRHMSNDVKQKISNYAKTRTGEKNSMFGKKHSEESKIKMSESRRGKGRMPKSEETKAKMRAAWIRRKEKQQEVK